MNSLHHLKRRSRSGARPTLSLITTPSAPTGPAWHRAAEERHELTLTFGELTLIYKSLQAVKALGSLPRQDELLNDTIQLFDQALNEAA
jgi:hypothetical protein